MLQLGNTSSKIVHALAPRRWSEPTREMKRTEEAQWRAGGVNGDGGDAVIAEKKTYANGKTGKCQDSLRGTKGWCHSKELKNSSPHRRWG